MNQVIIQLWEESIKDKNPIPSGCTIHLTLNDRDSFVDSIYNSRNNTQVPEIYERIVGKPTIALIESDLYNRLLEEKNIKLAQNEMNNLLSFEEILIKEL